MVMFHKSPILKNKNNEKEHLSSNQKSIDIKVSSHDPLKSIQSMSGV